MGSIPPYGYQIYKLQGEKGNSLKVIPEEAKIVKMIYNMYGQQGYNITRLHISKCKFLHRQNIWDKHLSQIYWMRISWENSLETGAYKTYYKRWNAFQEKSVEPGL